MLNIDSGILTIDKAICKNISLFDKTGRGLLSQNILDKLRNFVEHIFLKIYANGKDIDNSYENITKAISYVQTRGNLRFLYKFHKLLQKSSSHYTLDEENSERLMLKYYEFLLRIKIFLKNSYNMDVLENINDFPLNTDVSLYKYYEKIAEKIDYFETFHNEPRFKWRYYIQKNKPFFVNNKIYYQVTFCLANGKMSKFDRIIAFTNLEISDDYAVKLSIRKTNIEILGKKMPVFIIDNWEVSIRPCEINNFANIFNEFKTISSTSREYINLMSLLTVHKLNLTEIMEMSDSYYNYYQNKIMENAKTFQITELLSKCRVLILNNQPGANIIRYLLLHLNNVIIKNQYKNEACKRLSSLNLQYGCIPFDDMPFSTSLIAHNPKFSDLLMCIDTEHREHEFLARKIKNNTEINGELYTKIDDLQEFENIDELVKLYNNKLYYKHYHRSIQNYHNQYYISGYEKDTVDILKVLKNLSSSGINKYTDSFDDWLSKSEYLIDCEEKKAVLRKMFEDSRVALIYGSAGTGKSTIINHLSNFFNNKSKLYLANTNPAIDNLKRKVKASNVTFKTIASFLMSKNFNTEFDILIIDECSTVSNRDMVDILKKTKFKLLVLVGDIYQIESIIFGNWFNLAKNFIKNSAVTELTTPYRSNCEHLLNLWNKVRNMDDDIIELITKKNYSKTLDDSIFERTEDDEIILCLNYDGLYGINNINNFLQENNPNPPYTWGVQTYKVDDPIIFNESERFSSVLYNNLKGKIVDINLFEDRIQFDIEIDKVINESDIWEYSNLELVDNPNCTNSVVRFSVYSNKVNDDNDDDESLEYIAPFQIAYAISIHKAQGLEYNSVKIVITNEIDEMISHNIFYTAITRAKQNLKIYWSPESEKKVLENLEVKTYKKDISLLRTKFSELKN